MFGSNVLYKRTLIVLTGILMAALVLAGISVGTTLAQGPVGYIPGTRLLVMEAHLPPDSPDAPLQPAPLEYVLEHFKFEVFPEPMISPQPDTYCWDYPKYGMCDCDTHQWWEYWCHRCCNHPDNCPTGCCDMYCWWVEAGTCSCK